jgi:hypothetical protein
VSGEVAEREISKQLLGQPIKAEEMYKQNFNLSIPSP